jgi:hypothetical protein
MSGNTRMSQEIEGEPAIFAASTACDVMGATAMVITSPLRTMTCMNE